MSMEWNRPVTEVIGDRLWLTIVLALAALPGLARPHKVSLPLTLPSAEEARLMG